MGAGLVLALAGPAPAGIELPDGFDPDDYEPGAYLLGAEEGNSWTQTIWVNQSNLSVSGSWGKINYQFRICTNPTDPYGAQSFEAPTAPGDPEAFSLRGYGQGYDTIWDVAYAPHLGVDNALMWANGAPTGAGSGDYVYVTFKQGECNTYMKDDWWETPEFVLQMQAYGYKTGQPVQRLLNAEFYCKGAGERWDGPGDQGGFWDVWGDGIHAGDSTSQPRPALASGATYASGELWACPEWTQNSPLPEPASVAVWGLLGGLGIAGAWWRRRRKAA